jgi:nucleoside phosphorylase
MGIVMPSFDPSAQRAAPEETGTTDSAQDSVVIDFAILTAIAVERRAVCAAFGIRDVDRVRKDDDWYWRGALRLPDGSTYQLVVAQPLDMGNIDAAVLAATVAHHWRPRAALLVGIAASADLAKVRLGDVVVGRSVIYYEHGKVTSRGVQQQQEMIHADPALWKCLTAFPEWDGHLVLERPDGTVDRPKDHLGVIASGEKVIADAAVRDQIATAHRKILAIEMEGYGFSRALWSSSVRVPHLVIRGICDGANDTKDDRWHSYAAAAAAAFAKHFLLAGPLKPQSSSEAPETPGALPPDHAEQIAETDGHLALAFTDWLTKSQSFVTVQTHARLKGKVATEPYDIDLHLVRHSRGWRIVNIIAGVLAVLCVIILAEDNVGRVAIAASDATGIAFQTASWTILLCTLFVVVLAWVAWRKATVHAWVMCNDSQEPVAREHIDILEGAVDDIKEEHPQWKSARAMIVSLSGFTADAAARAWSHNVECYQPDNCGQFTRIDQ